jgi:hypothetical protein
MPSQNSPKLLDIPDICHSIRSSPRPACLMFVWHLQILCLGRGGCSFISESLFSLSRLSRGPRDTCEAVKTYDAGALVKHHEDAAVENWTRDFTFTIGSTIFFRICRNALIELDRLVFDWSPFVTAYGKMKLSFLCKEVSLH